MEQPFNENGTEPFTQSTVANSVPDPHLSSELQIPDIHWESSGTLGVHVPVLESPLSDLEMEQLKEMVDPLAPSDCHGMDIYMATVECVEHIINTH